MELGVKDKHKEKDKDLGYFFGIENVEESIASKNQKIIIAAKLNLTGIAIRAHERLMFHVA